MAREKGGVFRERKRKSEKATCSFPTIWREREKKTKRLVCTDGARRQSHTVVIFMGVKQ